MCKFPHFLTLFGGILFEDGEFFGEGGCGEERRHYIPIYPKSWFRQMPS
jgi:hypothetical protein